MSGGDVSAVRRVKSKEQSEISCGFSNSVLSKITFRPRFDNFLSTFTYYCIFLDKHAYNLRADYLQRFNVQDEFCLQLSNRQYDFPFLQLSKQIFLPKLILSFTQTEKSLASQSYSSFSNTKFVHSRFHLGKYVCPMPNRRTVFTV